MSSIPLEEAQARLPELIAQLPLGIPLILTQDSVPIAQLTRMGQSTRQPIYGRGKGKGGIIAEDEGHLEDFHDYMP